MCDESLENCGNVRSMRHGDFYGLVEYIVIHNSGAGYLKSTQYTGGACRGTGDNYGLSVDVNKVPGTSVGESASSSTVLPVVVSTACSSSA